MRVGASPQPEIRGNSPEMRRSMFTFRLRSKDPQAPFGCERARRIRSTTTTLHGKNGGESKVSAEKGADVAPSI